MPEESSSEDELNEPQTASQSIAASQLKKSARQLRNQNPQTASQSIAAIQLKTSPRSLRNPKIETIAPRRAPPPAMNVAAFIPVNVASIHVPIPGIPAPIDSILENQTRFSERFDEEPRLISSRLKELEISNARYATNHPTTRLVSLLAQSDRHSGHTLEFTQEDYLDPYQEEPITLKQAMNSPYWPK